MKIVPEEFGKLVFNENAMKKALSKEVFEKLEHTIIPKIVLQITALVLLFKSLIV